MENPIIIDGITVDNITREQAINRIMELLHTAGMHYIVFVNAESIVLARHNAEFRKIVQGASLRLVDGIGMQLAARLQGKRFVDNCNGTDLFPVLCNELSKQHAGLFLLGGKSGRAQNAGEWVKQTYPGVNIVGSAPGYFSTSDQAGIVDGIRKLKPDMLFVGLGSPRQEIWIQKYLHQTGARVAMGVGGLFDFYSGSILRAPLWMRKYRIEWLWRILRDPKRWPRLMRLIEFIYIILIH